MLENKFKTKLIKEIERRLPGSIIFHLDASERQGAPDLLVLYRDRWAALEGKRSAKAARRPNQGFYVKMFDDMSFARIISPENSEEVLNDLERSLSSSRTALDI